MAGRPTSARLDDSGRVVVQCEELAAVLRAGDLRASLAELAARDVAVLWLQGAVSVVNTVLVLAPVDALPTCRPGRPASAPRRHPGHGQRLLRLLERAAGEITRSDHGPAPRAARVHRRCANERRSRTSRRPRDRSRTARLDRRSASGNRRPSAPAPGACGYRP